MGDTATPGVFPNTSLMLIWRQDLGEKEDLMSSDANLYVLPFFVLENTMQS